MSEYLITLSSDLAKAMAETLLMVSVSAVFAVLVGIPAGFLLFVSERKLFWNNSAVHAIGSVLVNVIRSVPFVILLVLLLPLTQKILGTTIGPVAASVPLSVAAIAFYARLVQASLFEVDAGVIEAAVAFGSSPWMILSRVLFVEAFPSLLRGFTVTLISLVGYAAMAGIVGGGGIGDLAIRFGYYRYQTDVMIVTVVALIALVQLIQSAGDAAAERSDHKKK